MFRKIIKGLKDVWCGTLEFDTEPKKGSYNPVTSDGVYEAINGSTGAKEIVYFDVDLSDPPSGIYEAIGEALSNNKIPVIKIDGAVYFYTATGTDKYVFVGGYTKEAVGYTEIEVSDDDSVTSKSVDDKVFNMFLLYKTDPASPGDPPGVEDYWICDENKHVITKDELLAAHADCRYFILNNAVEPDSNSRKYFASVTVISNSYVRLQFYMMQYDDQGVTQFYQKTVSYDSEGRLYISDAYSTNLAGVNQAVLVSEPQSFDDTQKAQGRANIGAASASDVTALQSQVSSLSDVSAYSVKGEATVAQLNAGPSGIQAGWAYQLTDSGTLTEGTLAVVAGDTVAWDGTKWFPLVKSDYYATKTYAQNVAHSIAPEFDPTRDEDHKYLAGESVVYTDGKVYTFKVDHYGVWSAGDVEVSNAIGIAAYNLGQVSEKTKNLAEIKSKEQTTSSGLTYSFALRNYITISGTTTSTGNNDVSLYLSRAITIPAGKYTISIKGTFVKHNTTTCYLMKDGGSNAGYSSFNDNGVCTITVSSESTILRILIRFNNIQAVSVDGYLQLEAGDAATSFENSTTAIDYKARNDINLFKETTNLVNPIFINGAMSSGAVDLSNTSSCEQWIVTEKIYHINKGSRIDYIGNDSIYFIIAKFVGGSYDSNVLAASFNGSFYFNEDMDVRFAMRKADYSNITPNLASSNLKFSLYAKDSQTSDLNIIFYGLGSGESYASGQATLFKLPNGKNLLIDSYLDSYHNAMANALQAAGVRRIDYYVQTHYHGDHTGILNILRLAPTRIDITGSTFFLPPTITLENIAQVTDNAQTLVDRQTAMETYCTDNDCTVVRPDSSTYYDLGGGVKMKFYNTDHTDYSAPGSGYYSTNYNDWSICPEIFFGLKVVNVSADIGPIAQRKVAGTCFKADILTAPHHGWDNGVNNLIPAYINNVSPNVVISQNGSEHLPTNDASPASVMKASSPMQSYCEANGVPNYMTCLNGPTKVIMSEQSWKFDGTYSRYIRNGKNWSYTDNSEHIEN